MKQKFIQPAKQPNKKWKPHNGRQNPDIGNKCSVDIPTHGLCYFILSSNKIISCSDKMLESAVVSLQQDNYACIQEQKCGSSQLFIWLQLNSCLMPYLARLCSS